MSGKRGENEGKVWEKCGPSGRVADRSVPTGLPLGPRLTGGYVGLAYRLARWWPTGAYGVPWVPGSSVR